MDISRGGDTGLIIVCVDVRVVKIELVSSVFVTEYTNGGDGGGSSRIAILPGDARIGIG